MSATLTADDRMLRLCGLLGEYAGKLRSLNDRMLTGWVDGGKNTLDRLAVTFDQFEVIRKPLERVLSAAAQAGEYADADSLLTDELVLRLAETETELHHGLRLIHDLKEKTGHNLEKVARLRVAAGLNAMKGGPLRPAS